ncbi:MAG: hypothetical protein J6M08_02115 [Methanobrevibacter sp.]|nr:hypothetical protein [Methanobrevibacter sp.]
MTRTCGNCKYPNGFNFSSTKLICRKHNIEVNPDNEVCDDFEIKQELLNKNSCCGVCECYLMDGFCGYHNKYVDEHALCEKFDPVEEFLKGML